MWCGDDRVARSSPNLPPGLDGALRGDGLALERACRHGAQVRADVPTETFTPESTVSQPVAEPIGGAAAPLFHVKHEGAMWWGPGFPDGWVSGRTAFAASRRRHARSPMFART